VRARQLFRDLCGGNLTFKIKFSLKNFIVFLKLYHNLKLKVKFSLNFLLKFEIFCQISSAAPTESAAPFVQKERSSFTAA